MMPARERPHKRLLSRLTWAMAVCSVAAALTACSSVPGETLASGSVRRDVSRRVLAQANAAAPACKTQRITDTQVVEVHPDGKVALERWTVDQCGKRIYYAVTFPAAGKASPVLVRPE